MEQCLKRIFGTQNFIEQTLVTKRYIVPDTVRLRDSAPLIFR